MESKVIKRVFEVLDATVIRVPSKLSEKELDEAFEDIEYEKRYYPTDTGWNVRFCAADVGGLDFIKDLEVFSQKGGWDHEHCYNCDKEIMNGEVFYTVHEEHDAVVIRCEHCQKSEGRYA